MRAWVFCAQGFLLGTVLLGWPSRGAFAQQPPSAGKTQQQGAIRGAIVVAIGDDASQAARTLALAVYRDDMLVPPIDDAWARALVGEVPSTDAPAKLKEISEVRRLIGTAESDIAARRLLASLGTQARVQLVVAVKMISDRPVAKVLDVAHIRYAPVELGATIHTVQPSDSGSSSQPVQTFEWSGATTTLRTLVSASRKGGGRVGANAVKDSHVAVTAKADSSRPVWTSPWFWGPLGGIVVAGVTIFVLAQTSSTTADTMYLRGRIAP